MYWPLPLTTSEFIGGDCPENAGKEVDDRDPDDTVDSPDATLYNPGPVLAKAGKDESPAPS